MPGPVLTVGTPILCQHGGVGQLIPSSPRVTINGQPALVQTDACIITGCALQTSGGPFCLSAQWITATTRVQSNGMPMLLIDSQAVCSAVGTGVLICPSSPPIVQGS